MTTTETPETVFAREELSKKGFVGRPARFKKTDNGKIPLPPVMADMVQQYDEWIDVALKRAENKVTSGKYNPNTAILVRVDNWAPLPMNFRVDLVNKTRERLGGELNQVYGVYYLHRNVIDEVEGHRTGR